MQEAFRMKFQGKNRRGVSTINLIFYVTFLVFSVFATLLITKIMGSVLMLIAWDRTRSKVLEYIVPVWEVTGTFGVFWVVVVDFSFPGILLPAAHIYAVAIMLFLILMVARNASIVFGEYIMKKGWLDEKKLYQAYSLSTIVLGTVVLVILSSIISGKGVDLANLEFQLGAWLSSGGSYAFIIGTLLIGVGLAPPFFGLKELRFISLPATFTGVGLSLLSYYLYLPALLSPYIAIPVVITLLVPVLFSMEKTNSLVANKLVFALVSVVILFSLNFLVYPNAFGKTLAVDSITTAGPMAGAFITITVLGGFLLAVMLAIYLFAARKATSSRIATAPGK